MSASTVCILVLLAIAISIFVSWKLNTNLGVLTLVFAYIIGCLLLELKVKDVVNMTPINIVFQLVAITMFFAFATQNGTLTMIAGNLLYKVRNHTWFLPFALFLIGVILGFMGAPPPAVTVIIAGLAHPLAKQAGFHPLLAVLAATLCGVGADVPYAASGIVMSGVIEEMGMTGQGDIITWKFFFCDFLLYLAVLTMYFFVLKGHRARAISIDKPAPATPQQKKTVTLILVIIALVIIPNLLNLVIKDNAVISFMKSYMDIQMLAIVGVFLCTILKLGDEKQAITKGVPWNTVVMVSGVVILIGVADHAGVVDLIANAVSSGLPTLMIAPILCLIGAFLSFFSGAINVVFPMLASMIPTLVASTSLSPASLCIAIGIGACATCISPFSTGGAVAMSSCPDESLHPKLFAGQLGVCGANIVVAMIASVFLGMVHI